VRAEAVGASVLRSARALCVLALLLPALAWAAEGVPKPVIDIARPGKCVEDTASMRRDHPEMLKHQRDLTMHDGIRTKKYSLKECVACHAGTKTGSVLGEKGFCESCHNYASVSIDCFRCHAAKPKAGAGAKP
jgi:hypothetical protein